MIEMTPVQMFDWGVRSESMWLMVQNSKKRFAPGPPSEVRSAPRLLRLLYYVVKPWRRVRITYKQLCNRIARAGVESGWGAT